MTFAQRRAKFEKEKVVYESALLKFEGVDGFDVYNTSIPFEWEGKTYLYGRVERRAEWARSWVRLFEKSAPDTYVLKKDSMIYQLEDPYIAFIGGELVYMPLTQHQLHGLSAPPLPFTQHHWRIYDIISTACRNV